MTVIEMVQVVAIRLAEQNGSFNASEVQSFIGDGNKQVHISYVRNGCGKLVASGKLKVVGEGKNRKYAHPTFEYNEMKKDKKETSSKPKSNMRILDMSIVDKLVAETIETEIEPMSIEEIPMEEPKSNKKSKKN